MVKFRTFKQIEQKIISLNNVWFISVAFLMAGDEGFEPHRYYHRN